MLTLQETGLYHILIKQERDLAHDLGPVLLHKDGQESLQGEDVDVFLEAKLLLVGCVPEFDDVNLLRNILLAMSRPASSLHLSCFLQLLIDLLQLVVEPVSHAIFWTAEVTKLVRCLTLFRLLRVFIPQLLSIHGFK